MNRDGFVLDHGIHGLYSAREETRALVAEMVERFGADWITINKKTSIYFRGHHLKYPMGIRDMLRALPITTSGACILDFVRTRLRGRLVDIGVADSFEDWVTDRFGHRLYEIYFGPYVEKVWGLSGTRMSSAWLARRISTISIVSVIASAVRSLFGLAPKGEMQSLQPFNFFYPPRGSGQFTGAVEEAARAAGARIHYNSRVNGLRRDASGWVITVETPEGVRNERGDAVVSSLPLPVLIRLLGDLAPPEVREAAQGLRYRSMCIINLFVDRPNVYRDQWVYYSARDLPFNRINEFTNLAPGFSPEGKTALNCEITCTRGDEVWNMPDERLRDWCIDSLVKLGVIDRREVFGHSVARLPTAYPIFDVGCEKRLGVVLDWVQSLPGVATAGRQGRFEYINMDECIWHATESVRELLENPAETGAGGKPSTHDSALPSVHR